MQAHIYVYEIFKAHVRCWNGTRDIVGILYVIR